MKLLKANLCGVAVLLAVLVWASPAFAQGDSGSKPIRAAEPRTDANTTPATVTCCARCTGGNGSCSGCTEYTGDKCPGETITASCTILSDKAICSPKSTSKPGREPSVGSHLVVWLTPSGSGAKLQNFDIEIKDNKIVGVSIVGADGRREPLKPRNREPQPPGPNGCGKGTTLSCWESEEQLMSICLCLSNGPLRGQPQTIVN